MHVTREDLMEAAEAGLLQYTEVDPLLVFLRMREVQAERQAVKSDRRRNPSLRNAVVYFLAIVAVAVTAVFAMLYSNLSFSYIGTGGLLWFIGLYGVLTLAVAMWTERRRLGGAIRLLVTSIIALLPLAVFAAQHLGVL